MRLADRPLTVGCRTATLWLPIGNLALGETTSETQNGEAVQKVLDVRKVGADYEEHQAASPLDIPVFTDRN